MMNALIALGLGIVVFGLIVGVGLIVMDYFGDATAVCGTVGGGAATYTASTNKCTNSSGGTADPTNAAWTTPNTITGYVQSNLITWVPAIIALGVGLLFIGALMGRKVKNA